MSGKGSDMKNLLLIILVLMLFGYPVYASNLQLSESSVKFGNVKEGPPVEKKITITNGGTETINIANISTSCACTTVNLKKSALEPGESTELLITYNTFKYPGKFDKTVTILTGPEGNEETVIHLLGNVTPVPMGVIAMEPRKTVVGELQTGKENNVPIVIKNEGDALLTVSRIYSSKFNKEYYNESNSEGIKIAPGKEYKVYLSIIPPKPGRFLDVILIFSDARNEIGKGYKGLLSGTAK